MPGGTLAPGDDFAYELDSSNRDLVPSPGTVFEAQLGFDLRTTGFFTSAVPDGGASWTLFAVALAAMGALPRKLLSSQVWYIYCLATGLVSKAFTRESDDVIADEVASVRPHLSASAENYITREGADRLRERLGDLLEEKRVLTDRDGEATPTAKAALSRLGSAIKKLQSTLNSAVIIEPPADQERVALGASVRVRDEHGEEETYRIVGIDEADAGHGQISSASPLARALLTRRAGEKVRFQSPGGEQQLSILSVHY